MDLRGAYTLLSFDPWIDGRWDYALEVSILLIAAISWDRQKFIMAFLISIMYGPLIIDIIGRS